MTIEEKDNRQNIKVTTQDVRELWLGDHTSLSKELGKALHDAMMQCEYENKAQEILIVIDKGF